MSNQPAWLIRTDLCSHLGHLQKRCEALADNFSMVVPHSQQSCPQHPELGQNTEPHVRAVKNVTSSMQLPIPSATRQALCMQEAWHDHPALLNGQCMRPDPELHKRLKPLDAHKTPWLGAQTNDDIILNKCKALFPRGTHADRPRVVVLSEPFRP